ncbi:MAG: pyrroline-5-carboxylate reductase [Burkholderiaceae bacterium]|nr:pyrroline-5-carboxylate reductase [Burkholderiaceae bacterium]
MAKELTIAFIGGGNMASALASGLIGRHCEAGNVHVVDPGAAALQGWQEQGASVALKADAALAEHRVWIFAVKPQFLKQAVADCLPYLQPDTLVISVAAGISAATLSKWLSTPEHAFTRLVRCMPNTPALIGAGASGLMALDGVSDYDRSLATELLGSVGQVVWVDSDYEIDVVTSLSGSGPAYVFLFLEALIDSATQQGLSPDQARQLALATLAGATQLAAQSSDSIATLRERVTSKGGTTAAALDVFQQRQFATTIDMAMKAATDRAAQLSLEFSQ